MHTAQNRQAMVCNFHSIERTTVVPKHAAYAPQRAQQLRIAVEVGDWKFDVGQTYVGVEAPVRIGIPVAIRYDSPPWMC